MTTKESIFEDYMNKAFFEGKVSAKLSKQALDYAEDCVLNKENDSVRDAIEIIQKANPSNNIVKRIAEEVKKWAAAPGSDLDDIPEEDPAHDLHAELLAWAKSL